MNLTRVGMTCAVVLLLFSAGCDKGLAPLNEPAGFSGVLYFKNWPPPGNVYELRLVAFNVYPADSLSILLAAVNGGAVVYPPIGATGFPHNGQDTLHYQFLTQGTALQVRSYGYVVLAWRYGPNVFADWRPLGVYTGDMQNPLNFTPALVRVLLHRIQPGVDMVCDFQNPPPRPWR